MTGAGGVFWGIVVTSLGTAFLYWRIVGESATRLEDKNVSSLFRTLSIVFAAWIVLTVVLIFSPAFREPWTLNFNAAFVLIISIFMPVATNMLLLQLPRFRQLVFNVPLERVVFLHSFRVLLGLGLLGLYGLGYLAPNFGLEAGIGDIAVGLTAIPVALLLKQKAKFALTIATVWNILGMLDLLNALRLGVRELLPFIISTQTPLLMGMIPLLAVPLYVVWHLYALRLLYKQSTPVIYKSESLRQENNL
jgi:heme/copper-type cytochrome/quinol oxidase subunit 4